MFPVMAQESLVVEQAWFSQGRADAISEVADDRTVGFQLQLLPHAASHADPSFGVDRFGVHPDVFLTRPGVLVGELGLQILQVKDRVVARLLLRQHFAVAVQNSAANGRRADVPERIVF
jgi:hypothetical protein